ncbi:Rha family transcriptional regulator [Bacillus sp. ISL-75]|uniref:Rha family transcriptional regulator n=1 Tax=Bacillus sp. ISL-75 TaxID=2819137 RepID=UPI001BE93B1A|nr:Rha family transcriptional regulator [Bacillus sp. ISL-75]MBT2727876.1 Rha family transcriptional regulator [Bacillus sp. ISL-75]
MNQLVFAEKNQAVTTSLIVSEVFGKGHDKVLRDIRNLGCSDEFRLANFGESTYLNNQNKDLPMFYMNKKGFTLLAMGYTGKEAMKFKEAYIDQFEMMEQELNKPKVLSEREQLVAAMKLSIESAEEIAVVKEEVKEVRGMVENQITLDHGEQRRVQIGIASRIYELERDKDLRPPLFAELYREIRNRFGVTSYKDIKRKDMQAALHYIEAWVPRMVLS